MEHSSSSAEREIYNTYIRKEKKSQINNLSFSLKNLEKEE